MVAYVHTAMPTSEKRKPNKAQTGKEARAGVHRQHGVDPGPGPSCLVSRPVRGWGAVCVDMQRGPSHADWAV